MNTWPGKEAIVVKGWLKAHQWLLLRRLSQLAVMGLFLLGPLAGVWWLKGNLSASVVLDTVPLADPLAVLQSLLGGHVPEWAALTGAVIVGGFYALAGGRVFCSWVCPVNMITDAAASLRRKLGIRTSHKLSRNARLWLLGTVLLTPVATGLLAWEWINPVSQLSRGLLFGMGTGWFLVMAVFLLDLLVTRHGWCGHLCPLGAFYAQLGRISPLRVSATRRQQCDDCMDCYAVCPEAQILPPALKGEAKGLGPELIATDCTRCGRCIDVCARDVFEFRTRFSRQAEKH
ncbi:quinol dehydrogenase ferredoxin subunit NapH [Kistimonas scapharcae]|uniref:Quinol dehydrogenase ferredoxin subunit NapH n=1 Tax=Kistimonas scapharcae TaxID=1036133 RepID=A0ABP8UZB5_9GAMM